jgi:hypothetical protein
MKKVTTLTIILLLMAVSIPVAEAQDEQKNQLLVVWVNSVIPSQVQQYEEAVKKQVMLMKKYNHVTPYYVYGTDDYYYYWVTFIENFGAFDDLSAGWFQFKSEVAQKDAFIMEQEFKGTANYILPQFFTTRPDLSFIPSGQTYDPNETPYFRFGYCYVKGGFEKEFEMNWSDWVALFKKYNIAIGWSMYEGILGVEAPFYLWGENYKNEVDMAASRAKEFEAMGEEPNKLWQETIKLLRKIEYKTGWYRADLSYIPQN